jgi:hypothetical protein
MESAAKIQYSPTLTFGNILTVATLIITGTAIFAKIDARVWMLEETDRRRDVELKEIKNDVKDTRIEMREGFNRVHENLRQMGGRTLTRPPNGGAG